jgi:hypothetical protein
MSAKRLRFRYHTVLQLISMASYFDLKKSGVALGLDGPELGQ